MRRTRLRSTGKSVVAILCAGCFLAMSLGAVPNTVAADTWETWPKKAPEPGIEQKPSTDADGGSKVWKIWPKKTPEPVIGQNAGDAAGKKKATGRSYRTIGLVVLGIAAVVGIAIAAGGGGGGGGTVTNPGHQ